jgi:hypothetical protein
VNVVENVVLVAIREVEVISVVGWAKRGRNYLIGAGGARNNDLAAPRAQPRVTTQCMDEAVLGARLRDSQISQTILLLHLLDSVYPHDSRMIAR